MKLGRTIVVTLVIVLILLLALLVIDRVLNSYFGPEVTGSLGEPINLRQDVCTDDCNLSCSSLVGEEKTKCLGFCSDLCAETGG